ncbi:hypothetical protein RMCBS344292_13564 [Rhizopus microsporus]|nr:hypothetical protein RMCBS344292_13564 [Rhizopus microsporus]
MAATRNLGKRKRGKQSESSSQRTTYMSRNARDQPEDQPESSLNASRKRRTDLSNSETAVKKRSKGKQKEESVIIDLQDDALMTCENEEGGFITMVEDEEKDKQEEDEEDEDEIDWETVHLPPTLPEQMHEELVTDVVYKDVEVVFEAPRAVLKKSKWEMEYQRNLREWIHHGHVVALTAHYILRNRWCSSSKIKSRCSKIVPDHARNLLSKETSESGVITGIKWLLNWWSNYFSVTGPGLVTRPYSDFADINYDVLQEMILKHESNENADWIDSLDDFVNLLSKKEGTSDTCAELFVAVLRFCGCDARLVCSLQPVPHKIPSESTSKKKSGKGQDGAEKDESNAEETDEKSNILFQFRTPTKSYVNPNVQLRQKNAKPPCVWAEVYCLESKKWICVDPVRGIINKPALMEPATLNRSNQLSYVLAMDDKKRHNITDVTRRYTSNLEKAIRLRDRPLTKREQSSGLKPWSEVFLAMLCHKPKMGEKERLEIQDLEKQEKKERMPTSIGGFKNHPLYALERHLKKFEVLHPKEPVLGSIRGEKIYPRQCIKTVATADSYRKQGREIIESEQPIKMVKSLATTLEKKRLHEMAKQDGQEVLVPCYGEWQTRKIVPDPVVNGKVPKNAYGNIDLFTPEMLPPGAVHIPINGLGKVAKMLGIDYADAVTGFEFTKMRSVPIIDGIVVAEEYQYVLMEALEEQEKNNALKAIEKQEKEVYLRWRKLIKRLIIKARVDSEYGASKDASRGDHNDDVWAVYSATSNDNSDTYPGGGFLPEDNE